MQIKRTKLADADLIDLFVYGSQQFGESKATVLKVGKLLAKKFI